MNIGRNEQCPCGSGKKYKKCHLPIQEAQAAEAKRISDIDFEEWFKKDLLTGEENIAAIPIPEPFTPKQSPEKKE